MTTPSLPDTDRKLAERTIVYPHVIAKIQAEAAVEIVAAQHAEHRNIRGILGLDKPGARGVIVKDIDLGMGTWVVEIEGGPFKDRAPWTVIYDSKDEHTYFPSMDLALLYAIERRNGGGENSHGYLYAARVLRVPEKD